MVLKFKHVVAKQNKILQGSKSADNSESHVRAGHLMFEISNFSEITGQIFWKFETLAKFMNPLNEDITN